MKGYVKIRPYVLQNLSHPLNLGQNFLRYHRCDLYFREKTILLVNRLGCTALHPKQHSLSRVSTDARVQTVLNAWEKGGRNPPPADLLSSSLSNTRKHSHGQTHAEICAATEKHECKLTPPRRGVGDRLPPTTRGEYCMNLLETETNKRQLYTKTETFLSPHSARLVALELNRMNTHRVSRINAMFVD